MVILLIDPAAIRSVIASPHLGQAAAPRAGSLRAVMRLIPNLFHFPLATPRGVVFGFKKWHSALATPPAIQLLKLLHGALLSWSP
jgi:hypothetical protein